jgi:membrane dipeptidase
MKDRHQRVALDPASLHRDAVIVDGVDVSLPTRTRFLRMQKAGLTAVSVTVALYENFKETMQNIARWEKLLVDNADAVRPVRSLADIDAAKAEGRVGIVYNLQNTSPFEDDFGNIGLFRAVGVRIVQLAYMYQNLVGAGCLEPHDAGLTSYGNDVVRALNRSGIAIDLSHCGPRTTLDAIERSEHPVMFTHAASKALVPNPRNKTDDELRLLAGHGGVIGIVAFPTFLKDSNATIDDWFAHLEHILGVVGPDHVSIGSDWIEGQPEGFADRAYYNRPHPAGLVPSGWPWPYPAGIASVDDLPNITEGLVARGYDEETIRKILGGNLIRVLGQNWEANAR